MKTAKEMEVVTPRWWRDLPSESAEEGQHLLSEMRLNCFRAVMLLDAIQPVPVAQLKTLSNHPDGPASPERAHSSAPPVAILGIPFDNVTLSETVNRIQAMIESRNPHYLVTANVDFLVQAARDEQLRRILLNAHLVLCDGTPLVWASRWLGNPLPERVAGADLVPELIRVAAQRDQRLFFLGATPEANTAAAANVRKRFPHLIVEHYSPPFRPLEEIDNAEILGRVRQARPDVLFVAFGCPKAEKWIAMNYRALQVPVVIGIGATIDFIAGRIKRAPRWMQRCGAEWLFRLCQEPRRLFRRYANDLWRFSWELTRQAVICRPTRHESSAHSDLRTDETSHWRWIHMPVHLDVQSVLRDETLWRHADEKHCVLDMTDVRSVDSTGIGLLLQLRKSLRAAGKHLAFVPPDGTVQHTLEAMRVWDFLVMGERKRPSVA